MDFAERVCAIFIKTARDHRSVPIDQGAAPGTKTGATSDALWDKSVAIELVPAQ